MKKYKRDIIFVSIFTTIFAIIVFFLGNFMVNSISSDLSFGEHFLLTFPFYGTLLFTLSLMRLLFGKGNKKDIDEENTKEEIQEENKDE